MTSLLRDASMSQQFFVGGNVEERLKAMKLAATTITEACEYMTAFLHLNPTIGVLLNIDSDHLDYFKDMDHIVKSFKELFLLFLQERHYYSTVRILCKRSSKRTYSNNIWIYRQ